MFGTGTKCIPIFDLTQKIWTSPKYFETCRRKWFVTHKIEYESHILALFEIAVLCLWSNFVSLP